LKLNQKNKLMAANNLKNASNLLNENLEENLSNENLIQPNTTMHTAIPLEAKTGGQLNGGVVAQSAGRMAADGTEGAA
jgi:hypothetical protein